MTETKEIKQHTVRGTMVFTGRGIHTGQEVSCTVHPAPENSGILFSRKDLDPALKVKASIDNVRSDELRQTVLQVGAGVIGTIEHLMASFHGLGVDNAWVEVNGDEIPAMDGSAREFTDGILRMGLEAQGAPRRFLEVKEPVFVDKGAQSLMLLPAADFSVSYTLSYQHKDLRDQFLSVRVISETFEREIAPARTFCLKEEARQLQAAGFGRGANLTNTLVFENNRPVDNELRFEDEACRHKVLDLLGDLFLGGFIRGHVVAVRSGHTLNIELLKRLLRSPQESAAAEGSQTMPSTLNVRDIQNIIPHRYPFLFVDRIENFEPGVRATGYKQVTMNDYFFQGHFPGHPVMPGVLIIEAMAQVGGVIMLSKPENRKKIAYFMSIDSAKFRQPVVPGDELRFEVEVGKIRARTGQCTGRAFVKEKLVCEAEVKFAVVEP